MKITIYKDVIHQYKILFCAVVLLLFFSTAKAQYLVKEADAQFALGNYYKAGSLYQQSYNKKHTLHAAERAAESFAAQHDFRTAENWYFIASAMSGSSAKTNLKYAVALQQNSKYLEAKEQYKRYIKLNGNTNAATEEMFFSSCDSAMIWMQNPTKVTIINERPLNTPQSDWSPVILSDNIVFTSNREVVGEDPQQKAKSFFKFDGPRKPNRNVDLSTGTGYLRLYESNVKSKSIHFFPVQEATDYHVGPATFTSDGTTMYFVRSQTLGESKKEYLNGNKSKLGNLAVGIYSSTKDSAGNWGESKPFKYNGSDAYSLGDPFITGDGKQLYFSANFPTGMGGMDLYVCERADGGDWGSPKNLTELNTTGNERSPIIGHDGALYFSSDGRIGMGGLDIFKSVRSGNRFEKPINMHYPINSPQDDFAFNMFGENEGFLSSDRTGGLGSDDIYRFSIQKLISTHLFGRVLNKGTNQPLANATVILNADSNQLLKVQTDETGNFKFNFTDSVNLNLLAEKTGYTGTRISLSLNRTEPSKPLQQDLYLEQIALNTAVRLENIYYDFNKASIRADAAIELDKLVKIMEENPNMAIELGSHTDSRGSDLYNLKLSQNRANAAVRFMVNKGIDPNRIEAKGYGETEPVNKCINGVKCSEADYQLNRRTEFKITKK